MLSVETILIGILLYSLVMFYVSRTYDLPDSLSIWGPILTVRTQKGIAYVHKLAESYRSFWNYWGYVGVVLAYVTGLLATVLIFIGTLGLLLNPEQIALQGPTDMVVIPGVNRFLPVEALLEIAIALGITMVIHEFGHAIYCVLGDIRIKSTGLIFGTIIPIGAFVEPDENEQNTADTLDQLKMFSAGIANNYFVFIVSLIVVILLVSTMISPIAGIAVDAVFTDSPADEAGLQSQSVIQYANGQQISDANEYQSIIEDEHLSTVTTAGGETFDIPDGVFVEQAPQQSGVSVGNTITTINGTTIQSTKSYAEHVSEFDGETADIQYKNGETATLKIGSYVTIQSANELTDALNADVTDTLLIHSVDGQQVYNDEDLTEIFSENANETVDIEYWDGDTLETTEYTVNEDDRSAVSVSSHTSGVAVSDLGISEYPAEEFHGYFSFGSSVSEFLNNIFMIIILPIQAIIPGTEVGFAGFTPSIQSFYSGATAVFMIANILYWSAWININVAIFNSLPTYFLDGGFILDSTVKYFDISYEEYIIKAIQILIVIPILLMFIIPLVV